MRKFKILPIIWLILICANLFAERKIITKYVEGYGISLNEAVQNALIEAIKQIHGVKINSKKFYIHKIKEKAIIKNNKSSNKIFIGKDSASYVREITNGIIHQYRIVEKQKIDRYKWRVKLLVKIAKYKTPGFSPFNRRRIAVFPFRCAKNSFQNYSCKDLSRLFTQKIVVELTQSRKFTVLDREYIEEYLKEKNLILSKDTPLSEQIKIGQVLGVDYMLVGTINDFYIQKIPYKIEISGAQGYHYRAIFKADYRIIVMATRQIKWADSIEVILTEYEFNKVSDRVTYLDYILTKGAKEIVDKALDNIYPIKVVKIMSNGNIILNQGGKTLKLGEVLNVYNISDKLYDPYTKEFLGYAENKVATIKIIRVNPKVSFAKVIKGNANLIKVGSICRRPQLLKKHKETAGAESDVKIKKSGGVILPFDR